MGNPWDFFTLLSQLLHNPIRLAPCSVCWNDLLYISLFCAFYKKCPRVRAVSRYVMRDGVWGLICTVHMPARRCSLVFQARAPSENSGDLHFPFPVPVPQPVVSEKNGATWQEIVVSFYYLFMLFRCISHDLECWRCTGTAVSVSFVPLQVFHLIFASAERQWRSYAGDSCRDPAILSPRFGCWQLH